MTYLRRARQRKVSGPIATYAEICGKEVTVSVEFDHSPYEAATRDDPGCDSCLELTAVMLNGTDVMDLISTDELEAIEERVLDTMSSDEPEPDRGER